MRVTNKMITDRVVTNLARATRRYLELQTQASSGRRINKPSDDPLGISKAMNYRSRLAEISQFQLNVTHAKSWLSYGDQALDNIDNLVIQAKDLAVQLGNDTYDASARLSGASQIREMFSQVLDAANTRYRNRYIFSGSRTDIPPILANAIGVVYQGDREQILIETEKSSYLAINAHACDFLTTAVRTLGDGFDLNPGLQPNMWLSELHRGQGVAMGGGRFTINTINGSYSVNISTALNIRQVLEAINALNIPNFSASISVAGNSLQLQDSSVHHLTDSTPLAILNSGRGVSQLPGTFIIRAADNSISVTVDISGASTVGEVITAINNALAAGGINNVTASISDIENRIVLRDTNTVAYDLVIEESAPNQTTANDLGLVGEMHGTFEGRDLKPAHIQVVESDPGETLARDLGLLGKTEFETMIGQDLDPRLTYYTKLATLNNNVGIQFGLIRITNGFDYADIDLSVLNDDPDATILDLIDIINRSGVGVRAFLNAQKTGIMVQSRYDDRSLMITEGDSGRTAMALGIFGSPDLLGNMLVLEKALARNQTEEITATVDVFNLALDRLLTVRSSLGAGTIRAETSESRMSAQELLVTAQLSQTEDADVLKVATDLATAETIYQMSLASAARIMQPSLLDFLR